MDILIQISRLNAALKSSLEMCLLLLYAKPTLFLPFNTSSCVSTDKNRCNIMLFCFVHHGPLTFLCPPDKPYKNPKQKILSVYSPF